MKRGLWSVAAGCLLMTAGCAGIEIAKVTDKNAGTGGVYFYRPWPYLLVVSSADGKVDSRVVYLPRINEEYVIKVHGGLGTVNATFDLTDGWQLTKMGDVRDSKIPETMNAISGLATSVSGVLMKAQGVSLQAEPLPPGLYRFEFDEKTGFVKGLAPVSLSQD